jgi:hypothetical protein
VLEAARNQGQRRLLHMVYVISSHSYTARLVTHFYGNYTLQNLLDATSILRHALVELHQVRQWVSLETRFSSLQSNSNVVPFRAVVAYVKEICSIIRISGAG